jgi:hypothetical protein
MSSMRGAFVIMPFGEKKAADGTVIDFDAVYRDLLAPAIIAAGLAPRRCRRGSPTRDRSTNPEDLVPVGIRIKPTFRVNFSAECELTHTPRSNADLF